MRCTIYLPKPVDEFKQPPELVAIVALLQWQMWHITFSTELPVATMLALHHGHANPVQVFLIEIIHQYGDVIHIRNYNEMYTYINSRGLWLC